MFEGAGFLLGLLLGSFLNVCISRLPAHRSISKPRSHCPNCLETIRWYDNIPLLSWIMLAAKCRHCKQPIPWRYPLVEIGVALWFAVAIRVAGLELYAREHDFALSHRIVTRPDVAFALNEASTTLVIAILTLLLAGFLLIGLMVMDWQTQTLPDAFTLPGIGIGFFLICTQAIFLPTGAEDIHLNPQHSLRMNSPGSFAARGDVFLTGPEHLVFGRLLAILVAAAIPLLLRAAYKAIRGREGMGMGDAKLLAMIAAFLGFWPAVFALFVGIVLCSGYAAVLLARRRAALATRLPLGSFIAAGGLLATIAGEPLIAWYRSLL
jgi:leader peptidase (prepilin peptidase) / N-methyltransferase